MFITYQHSWFTAALVFGVSVYIEWKDFREDRMYCRNKYPGMEAVRHGHRPRKWIFASEENFWLSSSSLIYPYKSDPLRCKTLAAQIYLRFISDA